MSFSVCHFLSELHVLSLPVHSFELDTVHCITTPKSLIVPLLFRAFLCVLDFCAVSSVYPYGWVQPINHPFWSRSRGVESETPACSLATS